MGFFSKLSGLTALSDHYTAARDPERPGQTKQTVQFGAIRFRRCVTLNIGAEGLFLRVRPPLGKERKLLIPWDEFKQLNETTLYGRKGLQILLGDPEVGSITLYHETFEQIKPYLPSDLQRVSH